MVIPTASPSPTHPNQTKQNPSLSDHPKHSLPKSTQHIHNLPSHGLSSIRLSSPTPEENRQPPFHRPNFRVPFPYWRGSPRSHSRGGFSRRQTNPRNVSRGLLPLRPSNPRWNHSKGGFHRRFGSPRPWKNEAAFPEDRYVTYYVAGFPFSWDQWSLFHAIDEWENVVDTFIPRKRSAQGEKFGFVRFLRSRNTEEVRLRKLNATLMKGVRLYFNIARYGSRNVKGRSREGAPPPRKDSLHIVREGEDERRKRALLGFGHQELNEGEKKLSRRDARSFVEVLQGSVKKDGATHDGFINLSSPNSTPDWLSRSVVGTLSVDFQELKAIPEEIEVRLFGGDMILLTFKSHKEMKEALEDPAAEWFNFFSDLHPWRCGERSFRRLCWMQIRGLPIHVWKEEIFSEIIKSYGRLVKVDKLTSSMSRLDSARVCVITEESQNIDGKVRIRLDGIESQVSIKEEFCWDLPFDLGSRGGLGSTDGAMSLSPNSCTRAPPRQRDFRWMSCNVQEEGDKFRLPGGPRRQLWGKKDDSCKAKSPVGVTIEALSEEDQTDSLNLGPRPQVFGSMDRIIEESSEEEPVLSRCVDKETLVFGKNEALGPRPHRIVFSTVDGGSASPKSNLQKIKSGTRGEKSMVVEKTGTRRRRFKVLLANGSLVTTSNSRVSDGVFSESSLSADTAGHLFVEVEIPDSIGEEDDTLPSRVADSSKELENSPVARQNFELLDQLLITPSKEPSLIINRLAGKLMEERGEWDSNQRFDSGCFKSSS